MHFGQPHRGVALAASDRSLLSARDRNRSLKLTPDFEPVVQTLEQRTSWVRQSLLDRQFGRTLVNWDRSSVFLGVRTQFILLRGL
jgi:hypothetical protein